MEKESLYQEPDKLPVGLQKSHFQEGLVYTMTLIKEKEKPMLVMIIDKYTHDFLYRVFFVRSSSRKTYHQSGTDRKSKYIDIWRLAPRTKLVLEQDVSSVFIGETLRLTYGIEEKSDTIVVVRQTSSTITGILQCGKSRGNTETYPKNEITRCQEVFGSPMLHSLLNDTKTLKWTLDNRCKTRNIPGRRPTLNSCFMVPEEELYKRK